MKLLSIKKIKFIRNYIEGLIILQGSSLRNKLLKNFINYFFIIIFLIILSGIFNLIDYLIYNWTLVIIISNTYNSICYFIFSIENEFKIDLDKIKIKFIRALIHSKISLQNNKTINKELMKNYFLKNIYYVLILILITAIAFYYINLN